MAGPVLSSMRLCRLRRKHGSPLKMGPRRTSWADEGMSAVARPESRRAAPSPKRGSPMVAPRVRGPWTPAHENAMARERRSRAMWLVRLWGLQRRAKPDVSVTVPVVVKSTGWRCDARENRQGQNGRKDSLHDQLLWVYLAVGAATRSPSADLARLTRTGGRSHARVTKVDSGGDHLRGGMTSSRPIGICSCQLESAIACSNEVSL
jgi:hypothetical protein